MNIYLDLDGTLIDISERYFQAYSDSVISFGIKPLSKNKYWQLKKEKYSLKDIVELNCGEDLVLSIMKNLEYCIEQTEYLKLDKLIPGAIETLNILKQNHRLVLVTLRKHKTNLDKQLKALRIEFYFDKILDGVDAGVPHRIKADLIKGDSVFHGKNSLIVGDTEVDIMAGKILDIQTAAVLTGIRTEKLLSEEKPNYILQNISNLPSLIEDILS